MQHPISHLFIATALATSLFTVAATPAMTKDEFKIFWSIYVD